jgi:hypothetical protein
MIIDLQKCATFIKLNCLSDLEEEEEEKWWP